MAFQRFDGSRWHPYWFRFLREARKAGVRFHANSGKRTLREQWSLFRQNMYFSGGRWRQRPGRPLTAFPSILAPHIRRHHAGDFNGAQGLIDYGRRHGVTLVREVPGEEWHLKANWAQLRMFYRRHSPRR